MTGKRLIGRFALGATLGVALTIAATQAWNVTAAPGDTDSTFVPVAPCRLFDTRPGEAPLGGKKTPLGAGQEITQQVTGSIGNCVGIPTDAVAVTLNVTIVNPTAQSNLRLWPANASRPTASNLNWIARQAPTPNLVTVKLSPDGKIKAYNFAGTVDVIVDLAGYYTRTSLTEINQRLLALEAGGGGGAQPVVAYAEATDEVDFFTAAPVDDVTFTLPALELLTLTLDAPSAGKVTVVAHATAKSGVGQEPRMVCQITDNPSSTIIDGNEVLGIASPSNSGWQPSLGTNRTFDVEAGTNTFDLMCAATGTVPNTIHYRSMSAIFTPAS
jgi:hypothetical protein